METKKAILGLAVLLAFVPACRLDWAGGGEEPPNLVVISTSPADRQTNVAYNAQIVIRTSTPFDPKFVTPSPNEPWQNGQVILVDQSNSAIQIAYDFNGEYLTLVPQSPLAPQATYGVAIRPGAKDIYGQSVDRAYAFTFSTGSILTSIPNWPPFPLPPAPGLPPALPGTFSPTGQMNVPRDSHRDVRLNDGRVAVFGGASAPGGLIRSIEIYDPAKQTWTLSQANQGNGMFFLRLAFTATKLLNGQVLIVGGFDGTAVWDTSEIYDGQIDMISMLPALLQTGRYGHQCLLLANGNPIVTGGIDATNNIINSMEVLDLKTGTWVYTQNNMGGIVGAQDVWIARSVGSQLQFSGRSFHQSVTLTDKSILNIGGWTSSVVGSSGTSYTADLFWPSATGSGIIGNTQLTGTYMACPRDLHTATLLTIGYSQGIVVVTGGERSDFVFQPIAIDTYEVYDHNVMVNPPSVNGSQGAWTPGAMPMNSRRCEHTATLLQSGKILLVAGYRAASSNGGAGGPSTQTNTAEIFDPYSLGYNINMPWAGIDQTGRFDWTRDPQGNQTFLGGLLTGIGKHTATLLNDGRVLIAGGRDFQPPFGPEFSVSTCWLYNP